MKFYSCVALFIFSAVWIASIAGDTEGGDHDGCPSPGDLEGGDSEGKPTTFRALMIAIDKCWDDNKHYPFEKLRGLNETAAIRAVFLAMCGGGDAELHTCVEGVMARATCLSAEERTRLRLYNLYKETVVKVGCRDEAALYTNMYVGGSRPPNPEDVHPAEMCFYRERKDLGATEGGVNNEMIQEFRFFQTVLSCLNNSETEGHEVFVNSGRAMATALLNTIVCVDPTDGVDVLCKTILQTIPQEV